MYRYVWKIKLNDPTQTEEFISYWKETSQILQEYPGALGTHAHKLRGEEDSYFLIAEWESKSARDAMSHDIHNGDSERAKKWRSYPRNDSFGEVVSFAGEEFGVVEP